MEFVLPAIDSHRSPLSSALPSGIFMYSSLLVDISSSLDSYKINFEPLTTFSCDLCSNSCSQCTYSRYFFTGGSFSHFSRSSRIRENLAHQNMHTYRCEIHVHSCSSTTRQCCSIFKLFHEDSYKIQSAQLACCEHLTLKSFL